MINVNVPKPPYVCYSVEQIQEAVDMGFVDTNNVLHAVSKNGIFSLPDFKQSDSQFYYVAYWCDIIISIKRK